MKKWVWIISLVLISTQSSLAQNEPSLQQVFDDLGLNLKPQDEINVYGPTQGLFLKTGDKVQYLLVAKHSFGIQPVTSEVRTGYYHLSKPDKKHLLFSCGPKAGDQSKISGLPASPKGSCYFNPGNRPFGLYVQSANFNPEFSNKGETVYTQDHLNKRITRFRDDIHKAHIYPYKTKTGIKEDWFVICWEFSTNNDNQDIVTVIRNVKLIIPPVKRKDPEPKTDGRPLIAAK